MQDNVVAAAAGAIASSLNFKRKGFIVMIQVFISGFFLSYFGSVNIIDWLKENGYILSSWAIIYFLIAYFGNLILERLSIFVKGLKIALWKKS